MKHLLRIAKITARKRVKELRTKSPFFCASLQADVFVSKQFFDHIAFKKSAARTEEDRLGRLLLTDFIDEILGSGIVLEERDIQREDKGVFFKVGLRKGKDLLSLVILKLPEKCILVSCFIDYDIQKKNLS